MRKHDRCDPVPRIELAGDAVDAWPLVSPFASEKILLLFSLFELDCHFSRYTGDWKSVSAFRGVILFRRTFGHFGPPSRGKHDGLQGFLGSIGRFRLRARLGSP